VFRLSNEGRRDRGSDFSKRRTRAFSKKQSEKKKKKKKKSARLKTRTAAATKQRQKRTWSFTFKLMCSPLSSFFSSSESILFEMCFLRFV